MTGEAANDCEPELYDEETNVLVERIENQFGQSVVVPGAMHQEKAVEESELSNGVVRVAGGLLPFEATDTDTDMGGLMRQTYVRDATGNNGYTCIMPTSLAPSPIARVTASLIFAFTRPTTSAF